MTIHTDEKPFMCSICDNIERFSHIATNIEPLLISFLILSAIYTSPTHKALHTEDNTCKCPISDYLASCPYSTTHMTIHTEEKPYMCPFCDNIERFSHVVTNSEPLLISFLILSVIYTSPNLFYIVNGIRISKPSIYRSVNILYIYISELNPILVLLISLLKLSCNIAFIVTFSNHYSLSTNVTQGKMPTTIGATVNSVFYAKLGGMTTNT